MAFDLLTALRLAGLGQIVLALSSLAIPGVLGWSAETARLRPLLRQMFWTYGAYILVSNLSFGLLSFFGARLLLEHTPLSAAVNGFIALWWGARVAIQFFYFDRTDFPSGAWHRLAEVALVALFVYLTAVYTAAAAAALSWI